MFLLQSEYVLESVVTKVMNLNLVHVDAHYEIDPDQAQENFINIQRKGQKQLLEYAQLGKEANKKWRFSIQRCFYFSPGKLINKGSITAGEKVFNRQATVATQDYTIIHTSSIKLPACHVPEITR